MFKLDFVSSWDGLTEIKIQLKMSMHTSKYSVWILINKYLTSADNQYGTKISCILHASCN